MLAAIFAFMVPSPPVVFVSPQGPIRTVQGGIDAARALEKANPGGVEVRIQPGSYTIEHTIKLTGADRNLAIDSPAGAMPRLIGGKRLGTWHPVTDPTVLARIPSAAQAQVLECDLTGDDQIDDLGAMSERGFGRPRTDAGLELFYNGTPMQIARYPNADAPGGGWLKIASVPTKTSITYTGDEPDHWLPSDDAWVFGYWQFDWAESYEHITKLDAATKTVEFNDSHLAFPPMPGRRFYFLNVLEELDEPGEWYLDRQAKRVYFWPPSPIDTGEAIASTLNGPMFEITGATNLTISGLDLESGRGAGIVLNGGEQDWIRDCVVRNFGTLGISIVGAKDSGVTGCDLTNLGELGISINSGDRKTLTPGSLKASDNEIWNYARWCRTYQPGVQIDGVGNEVSHNRIHDAPHQAILLSGNDHLIEFNDFSKLCTETGDAGAVYMGRDPTMRGNQILYNRFTDLAPKVNTQGNFTEVMGVYLDDCFDGATIDGNIFDMRGTAVMLGGGRDNTISNNVFLDCKPAIHFDARGKGWAAKYFVPNGGWNFFEKIAAMHVTDPPYSTRYPKLATILSGDLAFPAGNAIDSNICLGGQWLRLLDKLTTKDFENLDNVVQSKSGTYDDALKVAPSSFKPIPADQIGLVTKRRPMDRLNQ